MNAAAFDHLPESARKLAEKVGPDTAMYAISRMCDTALLGLRLRETIKDAQANGLTLTGVLERASFAHGIPLCCLWRVVDVHGQALKGWPL
ncbi:hypothetical protein [Pseudomonas aeruginosa]|uniref:hypothetical protein n=1 Tax=Pseudomonas aeruginosa TaxID=287 RepID=UPI001D1971BE|nr:hypothetical protein [Pseudomonas aeruginosa]MCC4277042.1 hypothetical protein [Pseudomonas aeruginosa]